jgi:EAL domain-containing protein (putative c-di-GMP-specific phosphodiesterase class I)
MDLSVDRDGFRRALRHIWMAYQPIVCLKTKTVVGYEALTRCDEPGWESPLKLVMAAERTNGLKAFGEVVWHQVAVSACEVPMDALVFVNIHPRDLAGEELLAWVSGMGALRPRLVLEVTEREPLVPSASLTRRMDQLRRMGCRIALDDLGAGYADIHNLVEIEPDIVKLDGGLIHSLHRDPQRRAVVRAVVCVAKEMGIDLIAECVSSEAESNCLLELGCSTQQGWHFAAAEWPPPILSWQPTPVRYPYEAQSAIA